MTNREMFLLATSILFASTTAGMALQGLLRPGPHHGGPDRPGFEHRFDGDHKRPDFFAMSDTNKDGVITKDEMKARQSARLDEFFDTVDTNKDGKLTREEMEKGRELMRAKMKARFEAERAAQNAAAVPQAAAPAPAPTTPAPATH